MAWTLADPDAARTSSRSRSACSASACSSRACSATASSCGCKPAPRYLTRFYLMISLGGALGLGAGRHRRAAGAAGLLRARRRRSSCARCCCCGRCDATIRCIARARPRRAVHDHRLRRLERRRVLPNAIIVATRNFYGVLRVKETGDGDDGHRRSLIHGTIMHGKQYLRRRVSRAQPTTYYTTTSGIGRAARRRCIRGMEPLQGRRHRPGHRHHRHLRHARRHLPLLRHQSGRSIAHREARFHLPQRQRRDDRDCRWATRGSKLEREPPQNFDVLAIDAFSSDAIPVHLITSEAVDDLPQAHEAGRRHRLPRDQPLPRPRAGGRGARQRARPARRCGSATKATARSRAAATGCCCRRIRRACATRKLAEAATQDQRRARLAACGPTISTTWCRS